MSKEGQGDSRKAGSVPSNPDGTPPMVRLVGESGFIMYPKMVPDGKGGWEMADPEAVARALGKPPGPAGGSRSSSENRND